MCECVVILLGSVCQCVWCVRWSTHCLTVVHGHTTERVSDLTAHHYMNISTTQDGGESASSCADNERPCNNTHSHANQHNTREQKIPTYRPQNARTYNSLTTRHTVPDSVYVHTWPHVMSGSGTPLGPRKASHTYMATVNTIFVCMLRLRCVFVRCLCVAWLGLGHMHAHTITDLRG